MSASASRTWCGTKSSEPPGPRARLARLARPPSDCSTRRRGEQRAEPAAGVRVNDELRGLELMVEKLVPGGDGFLRLPDGQSLFVRGAAPGDRIRLGGVEKQR